MYIKNKSGETLWTSSGRCDPIKRIDENGNDLTSADPKSKTAWFVYWVPDAWYHKNVTTLEDWGTPACSLHPHGEIVTEKTKTLPAELPVEKPSSAAKKGKKNA